MANINALLKTASVCLEYGEVTIAVTCLSDALTLAKAMRPTIRMRRIRAHIAASLEALS